MSFIKHSPTLLAFLVEELLVECAVNTVTVTSIPESSKDNFIYLAIDWQLIGLWG